MRRGMEHEGKVGRLELVEIDPVMDQVRRGWRAGRVVLQELLRSCIVAESGKA